MKTRRDATLPPDESALEFCIGVIAALITLTIHTYLLFNIFIMMYFYHVYVYMKSRHTLFMCHLLQLF